MTLPVVSSHNDQYIYDESHPLYDTMVLSLMRKDALYRYDGVTDDLITDTEFVKVVDKDIEKCVYNSLVGQYDVLQKNNN